MPRSMRRPNEVSAGGVVVRRAEEGWEICLIRVKDAWSVPKGNVDRGETPEQAALREVSEETGLPFEELRLLGTLPPSEYVYRRDGRLIFKLVHHFLIEAPSHSVLRHQTSEIDEAAWFPFDEALTRISYRDLTSALEAARLQLSRQPS